MNEITIAILIIVLILSIVGALEYRRSESVREFKKNRKGIK